MLMFSYPKIINPMYAGIGMEADSPFLELRSAGRRQTATGGSQCANLPEQQRQKRL
jgi:hypothetical protein